MRHVKRARWKLRNAYFRLLGPYWLRRALRTNTAPRIVIGAQLHHDPGWTPTEKDFLDLLRPADWDRFFRPNSVAAILAEHVWEHLTFDEGLAAAKICFTYLRPGGYLRIAVPDGFHPDPAYIALVKVEGLTSDDRGDFYPTEHKALYTYRTARELFERAGFQVDLLEYFDEAGVFHAKEWSTERGTVRRSKRFDRRNQGGVLAYTSVMLDAVKREPGTPPELLGPPHSI